MNKVAIIYWSGTGNTEIMAQEIAKGVASENVEVDVLNVEATDSSVALSYDKIAFGCPSMGAEVLEESEFEPFFSTIEKDLGGKSIALFGSYGWGDGEWMRDWESRINDGNGNLFSEGLMINETPEGADLETCQNFGRDFAKS